VHGIAVARLACQYFTAEGSGVGQTTLLLQSESLRNRSQGS